MSSVLDVLNCPITHARMSEPVMGRCGHTFDKEPLLKWLSEHHNQCPTCRATVSILDLRINFAIKSQIEQEKKDFVLTLNYKGDVGSAHCGANYQFIARIKNNSEETLPECLLRLKGSTQHYDSVEAVPAIAPLKEKTVTLTVQSRHCTAEDLSIKLELQYQGKHFSFTSLCPIFTRNITDRAPEHCQRFNILVYGVGGSGKSSLICKMATLLDSDLKPNLSFAPVGSGERHVTTKLVRYNLPRCSINIWDTWGFNGHNYRDNTLAFLFEGRLPSGWEMGEMLASRVELLAPGEDTKHERRIHAAILVLEYSDLLDTSVHDALKRQFLQFKAFTPLVVVNKVDKLPAHITTKSLKALAADVCCVNPNSVFVNENYVTATERSAVLDKQTLLIMEEAISRAQAFEANHGLPESALPHDVRSSSQVPIYAW